MLENTQLICLTQTAEPWNYSCTETGLWILSPSVELKFFLEGISLRQLQTVGTIIDQKCFQCKYWHMSIILRQTWRKCKLILKPSATTVCQNIISKCKHHKVLSAS